MRRSTIQVGIVLVALCGSPIWAADSRETPELTKSVHKILAERCLECHGPKQREGGLLLTNREAALTETDSGELAIVPGEAAKGTLLARISSDDDDLRMPPDGHPLTREQVGLIKQWIDSGAAWPADIQQATHWSYIVPLRSRPPAEESGWSRNAIDRFISRRVHEEGLQPSHQAKPARLLRRVYLDIVGVPPSPSDVEAFEANPSMEHYEAIVDQLLSSPLFGQKWARRWLDLARYSDSNGYQADQIRQMWAFRDWVIEAMNKDMPFDQFTIEQLAGDLLPNATDLQRIATGFHRATTCNVEAGVDPEGNRTDQVIDRINTTATVWLGTTFECAQCHNHKYDPFTQKEYYQLFAFFNNTPMEVKHGSGVQYNFWGPKMDLPTTEAQARELSAAQKSVEKIKKEKGLAKKNDDQPKLKKLTKELEAAEKKLEQLQPTTLVMVENKARDTHVLMRGNFLDKGAKVEPNVPRVLHGWSEEFSKDRLGFAKWLTDESNPLIARVTVNRWWSEIFGRGLVRTIEDFGTQGEPPTHPELLDWLAIEFMESGWSRKQMLRLMVTSSTYKQASSISSDRLAADPVNAFLARGPRFRLSAEAIRDNALAIGGLISYQHGGPPVYPPQPGGLWKQTGRNEPVYNVAKSENRYRRGIYVVWRRAAPYPSFVSFDGPDRMTCVVDRSRTNTPLQALTLLNDEAYVEIARGFANRMLRESSEQSLDDQLVYAWQVCLSRSPSPREIAALRRLYLDEKTRLEADPAAVKKLLKDAARLENPLSRAAWMCVGQVLLNLDETINKG